MNYLICSFSAIVLFLAPTLLHSAEKVRIELDSGAILTGTLIKEKPDYLILDIGFDLLRIPAKHVLALDKLSSDQLVGNSFNESMFRQLQNAPTKGLKDLVNDLGEAVVMVRTPIGLGSGFIIHPEGYVVTNDHVIAGERKISITQFKQARSELTKLNFDNVRIVATGGNLDLALLKIEGSSEEFPTVPLGESIDVGQGERVFAIGSPLGLERSVSEGIVSLRNRIISDRLHVQTTAEISPGNSGGPLFNYKGEVVGVNNMKVVAQGAEGLGFAIPVDSLKTFLANRDAYAFDPRNPNAGFRYNQPPRTSNKKSN